MNDAAPFPFARETDRQRLVRLPLGPPRERRLVDVTDPAPVEAAVAGTDAVLNLTVIRRDPVGAFRVNLVGVLNIVRAAVAHGVRRVVQTGPIQAIQPYPAGYDADFGLSPEVPPRPGDDLSFASRLLVQEVCRVFALYPFTLSWSGAGEVLRRAVQVPALPRPFEALHPNADLPHGRYPNEKAKRLLGWRPRDRLEAFWMRDDRDGGREGDEAGAGGAR